MMFLTTAEFRNIKDTEAYKSSFTFISRDEFEEYIEDVLGTSNLKMFIDDICDLVGVNIDINDFTTLELIVAFDITHNKTNLKQWLQNSEDDMGLLNNYDEKVSLLEKLTILAKELINKSINKITIPQPINKIEDTPSSILEAKVSDKDIKDSPKVVIQQNIQINSSDDIQILAQKLKRCLQDISPRIVVQQNIFTI